MKKCVDLTSAPKVVPEKKIVHRNLRLHHNITVTADSDNKKPMARRFVRKSRNLTYNFSHDDNQDNLKPYMKPVVSTLPDIYQNSAIMPKLTRQSKETSSGPYENLSEYMIQKIEHAQKVRLLTPKKRLDNQTPRKRQKSFILPNSDCKLRSFAHQTPKAIETPEAKVA